MTIARASPSQAGGSIADATTPNTRVLPNNVTAGQLIVVGASSDGTAVFAAGDLTKSAGTATIGTVALDKTVNQTTDQHCGIWSMIVTGSGSLTLALATGGSFSIIGVNVYDGNWDGSRLEASNSAVGTTSTTPSSGNATSAGAALFVGVLAVGNSASVTLTQDSNFSSTFESTDGTSHEVGEIIDRIVTTGTTDDANWTINIAPTRTAMCVAVYKEVASGGNTTQKTMSDTMTLADANVSGAKRFKVPSDNLTLTEAQFQWRRLVEVPSDALTLTDQTVLIKRLRRRRDEGIDLIDSVVKALSGQPGITTKVMSEALTIADGLIRVWCRAIPDDTLDVTDQGLGGRKTWRLVGDTLTITEEQTFKNYLITGEETLDLTEDRWRRIRKRFDDALTLVDAFSKTVFHGSAAVYTKVMTDTADLGDDTTRSWLRRKRLGEDTFTLSDGFAKVLSSAGITYIKVMADSVVLVDDAGNHWTQRISVLADSMQLSDAALRALLRVRYMGETLEITEGQVRIRQVVRIVEDDLVVPDEIVKIAQFDQLYTANFRLGSSPSPFRFGSQGTFGFGGQSVH